MDNSIMIRKARTKDAEKFCNVIRTSITELCTLDHQGDEKFLSNWLENKTVENCVKWIEDCNSTSLIADINHKMVGVAHIGHDGHLHLCYLLPEAKNHGIGHNLLVAAEKSVIKPGVNILTLESTLTSRDFYESHGYKPMGCTATCLKYEKVVTS